MKKFLLTCITFFFSIWINAQPLWSLHNWKNETVGSSVTAVYVDEGDKVWACYFPRGLAFFDGNDWTYFEDNDHQKRVFSITQTTDGVYWFGGLTALVKFDGNSWHYYDNLNTGFRSIIEFDENIIWVGTNTGLYAFDKTGETFEQITMANVDSYRVNCLYKDSQNRIWAGTDMNGVFVYDNGGWTNHTYQNSGLPYGVVTDIEERTGGEIWIATQSGVVRYMENIWNVLPGSEEMGSLHVDNKSNLWMGGSQNVLKLDSSQLIEFTVVTAFSGIGLAYRIDSDSKCSVYFATNRGLSQLSDCMLMDLPEEKMAAVHVFPNPAVSFLNLALASQLDLPAEVRISDMTGRIVKQSQILELIAQIDIGQLPSGIYALSVRSKHGSEYIEKIIKQ